jgi:hypothetical protein
LGYILKRKEEANTVVERAGNQGVSMTMESNANGDT